MKINLSHKTKLIKNKGEMKCNTIKKLQTKEQIRG
jgi:hypothetical protein